MPYDEELADRVRAALGAIRGVTEIKMFGGLCFTVRGHMAVGVTGQDLMARLPADETEAALREGGVRPMDFTGKPMRGFVYVGPDGCATDKALQTWVDRSVAHASTMPAKKPKKSKTKP